MAMCASQLIAAPACLERMLASAVAREERFRPRLNRSAERTTSSRPAGGPLLRPSIRERADALLWLRHVNYTIFQLCPNNFALALNVFDRFLSLVKVQPKHIRCIAAASFLIAAKISQEPESEPSATEIVQLGGCNFTHSDITRMERIILDKLVWDVDATTPLSVLQLLHALVCSWGVFQEAGVSPMLHLRTTVQHLEACMFDENFSCLKPSALALAVLAVELRQIACNWLGITIELQTLAKVTGRDLSLCYEAVQTRVFHLRRVPASPQSTLSSEYRLGQGSQQLSLASSQTRSLFTTGAAATESNHAVSAKNIPPSPIEMDMQGGVVSMQANAVYSALNPTAKPFDIKPCALSEAPSATLSRQAVSSITASDLQNDFAPSQPPLTPLAVDRFVPIGFSPVLRCGSGIVTSPGMVLSPVEVA